VGDRQAAKRHEFLHHLVKVCANFANINRHRNGVKVDLAIFMTNFLQGTSGRA